MRVRQGQDLDACRRSCIEAGNGGAAAQGQGETLVAVAIEVARGQQVRTFAAAEVLVNFEDEAIHAVLERIGDLHCRILSAAGVADSRQWPAPRIPRQQLRDDRINRAMRCNRCLAGHAGNSRQAAAFAPSFISNKPEGTVFNQRTTERSAVLVVVEYVLRSL